ncbi:hypothetical protein ACJJTC_018650 [Scirpophaga incertulas]
MRNVVARTFKKSTKVLSLYITQCYDSNYRYLNFLAMHQRIRGQGRSGLPHKHSAGSSNDTKQRVKQGLHVPKYALDRVESITQASDGAFTLKIISINRAEIKARTNRLARRRGATGAVCVWRRHIQPPGPPKALQFLSHIYSQNIFVEHIKHYFFPKLVIL